MDILERARSVVAEREAAYGDPKWFCLELASTWSVIFGTTIQPEQVPLAMIALKVQRAAHMLAEGADHIEDTILDIIGYAYILSVIHGKA